MGGEVGELLCWAIAMLSIKGMSAKKSMVVVVVERVIVVVPFIVVCWFVDALVVVVAFVGLFGCFVRCFDVASLGCLLWKIILASCYVPALCTGGSAKSRPAYYNRDYAARQHEARSGTHAAPARVRARARQSSEDCDDEKFPLPSPVQVTLARLARVSMAVARFSEPAATHGLLLAIVYIMHHAQSSSSKRRSSNQSAAPWDSFYSTLGERCGASMVFATSAKVVVQAE